MTRCMLNDSGLPKKFWGEAIMTPNHLQNRLPVDGKETTPYEGWNKRKPDLSYVKEFGSVAYVSIPTEKRQKLDDKARKLVLVGYEKGTKGYRLLDVNTNRIQVSMISMSRERGLLWLRHEPLQSLALRFGTNSFLILDPLY